MKRIFALLLCVLMIFSLVACAGESESSGRRKNKDKEDGESSKLLDMFGDKDEKEDTSPAAEEAITLTIGLRASNRVLSYEDNALTRWVEEECNVKLQFVEYAGGTDVGTQIATTIAARQELPDILFGISLDENTLRRYGRDGYFLNLNEYYEDREGASKTFWTRLESEISKQEQQDVIHNITDPNTDSIFGVPTVETTVDSGISCKLDSFITVNCANPDKAFEVLMLLWSEEGSYRVRYGEKGVNWDEADAGTVSAIGLPAKVKVIDDPLTKQNTALWSALSCTMLVHAAGESVQAE